MADAKISALDAIASVATVDLLPIVDDPGGTPVTKKATVAQVRTALMPVDLAADVTGTLPVANGGTGAATHTSGNILLGAGSSAITSFAPGSGVVTWLTTPSSANLASAVTDETGSGALVFANTPTLVTPVIGAATGTSVALSSFYSVSTLGGAVASSGQMRWSSSFQFKALNAAETQNATLFNWSSDVLTVGDATYTTSVQHQSTTSHTFTVGGAQKAVIDSNGFRLNDGDGHYYTFATSNIAASRTCTLPILTGGDTFVFEAHAQTLTNKTIAAGSNTISGIANANIDAAAAIALSKTALSANAQTFLATPSSANLATLVSDETGSAGNLVFSTNPSLTAPTISSPATTGTGTYTNGKTTITTKTGEHQTTTATTATVTAVTTTIADNTTTTVDFVAIMRAVSTTAKAGRWAGTVTYYRNGSTPVIVGSATYDTAVETTGGDDVLFNLSSNDLQIQVTSADADDRNWSIEARVHSVTNAA
jgi:hypothetical protein